MKFPPLKLYKSERGKCLLIPVGPSPVSLWWTETWQLACSRSLGVSPFSPVQGPLFPSLSSSALTDPFCFCAK